MDLKILSLGVNHQLYDYDNPNMTFIHAQKKKKKNTNATNVIYIKYMVDQLEETKY